MSHPGVFHGSVRSTRGGIFPHDKVITTFFVHWLCPPLSTGSVCSSEGSSGARVFVDGKAQVKASLRSPDGRGDKGTNSSLEPEDGETPGRRSRGQKDGKRGRTRRDKKAPAGVSENREGDQAVIPRPWGPARRNLHKELVEARHLPLLSLGLGNGTGTPVRVQLVRQLAAYLQEQPSVRRVSATRALRNAAYKGWRLAGISSLRQDRHVLLWWLVAGVDLCVSNLTNA